MNTNISIAVLEVCTLVFIALIFMALSPKSKQQSHHNGNWLPSLLYYPVMLVRWAIVPHKDWMKTHKDNQQQIDAHHHHHHHHQKHYNEGEHGKTHSHSF